MKEKYGTYSSAQLSSVKYLIRKNIFFLLLYVDPHTKHEYKQIDIEDAFQNLQYRLNGLNSILLEPPELVNVMSLIEAALIEYRKDSSNFKVVRKLILDAGSEIMRLKEGDQDD